MDGGPGRDVEAAVRVFTAGRIVSMAGTEPAAFATVGEWVAAVGDVADLAARFPGAEVVDLGDTVVVPGLNDAHMHPSMAAEDLLHVDLSPDAVGTVEELQRALAEEAGRAPAGRWVRGSRYDHTKTSGGRIIDRADLDAVTGDHPVLVVHVAGHWGVVNSAGLAAGGLTDASEPPPGGDYGRDGAGRLTGVLYEQALFDYAYPSVARRPTVIAESGLEERLAGLARFAERLHRAGLTSIGDAMVGPSAVTLFQEAERRGELSLRVNLLLTHHHFGPLDALGMRTGFGGTRLRLGGIKAFVDGAIAGRTCLLEEPFEGSDDHGMQTTPDDELHAIVRRVHAAGSRVAVHANGDRAIRKLLDAVEAARAAVPGPGPRHRIEHCSVVDDDILDRMRGVGAIAVPFGSYVAFHGDKLRDWYGEKRLERMFAHRSFLDAGIAVAGSSDYPCGPLEPLLGLQSCVTRESADGRLLGGTQRITATEALALYTTGSALAAGEDRVKGRLAPGYLADFTVLGEDPLAVDPRHLAAVPVVSTWVGAERVWPGP